MPISTKKSFCRICQTACALDVDVEDGRAIAVRGDRNDPLYGGYCCLKGRQFAQAHNSPDRLRASLKRGPDGSLGEIGTEDAVAEIADHVHRLVSEHGPRSIGAFLGTTSAYNSAVWPIVTAFMKALGSPNLFTPMTIDQPGKHLVMPCMGRWGGGYHGFIDADVALIFGTNVLVSHYSPPGGIPPVSPSRQFREGQQRGTRVIVVDPRRTEVAARADMHLQIRPGEDAVLVAGMLDLIFREGLHDAAFCERYLDGVDALRDAVSAFPLDYVARRTDLPLDEIATATRLFGAGPRGIATTGTGPEMSPQGRVNEFLISALNLVCGRVCREGEFPTAQRVLVAEPPPRAEVIPPVKLWGEGFVPSRVRDMTQIGDQMPCATMADEILTSGEGQLRAMIVIGGNPVISFPNQTKVARALEEIELLVTLDPRLTQTAKRSTYVIAPKMAFEREEMTALYEYINLYENAPYGRYVDAIATPQGDVIEDWELFWHLARRLGLELELAGGPVPLDRLPSKYEILQLITAGSPVPIETVRRATRDGGVIFPEARRPIMAGDACNTARMILMPDDLLDRLREIRAQPDDRDARYTHLMISRRIKHFMNSCGHEDPALKAHGATNFAYMNPQDFGPRGITDDQIIEIESESGIIFAVARASADIKPGIISIAHAFGDAETGRDQVRESGNSTNRLVNDRQHDPVTGMAVQSAVPVSVRAARP